MVKATRQLPRRSKLKEGRLMPTPATAARERRYIVSLKRCVVL